MTVINLSKEREERSPHASGTAKCLDCGHEWACVAPTSVDWLECPKCGLIRGRFKYPFSRDGLEWKCGCGNDLFHVKPQGVYCPKCGVWQEFPLEEE